MCQRRIGFRVLIKPSCPVFLQYSASRLKMAHTVLERRFVPIGNTFLNVSFQDQPTTSTLPKSQSFSGFTHDFTDTRPAESTNPTNSSAQAETTSAALEVEASSELPFDHIEIHRAEGGRVESAGSSSFDVGELQSTGSFQPSTPVRRSPTREKSPASPTTNCPITTLMVRNLPKTLSQCDFLEELDKSGFAGFYDFCYMPCSFENGQGHFMAQMPSI